MSRDSVRRALGRVPRRARGRHGLRGVWFGDLRGFKGGFNHERFPINSFAVTRVGLISARVDWALRTRRAAALVSVWPFGAPFPCNSSAYFIIPGANLVCTNGHILLPSAALVTSRNHCL